MNVEEIIGQELVFENEEGTIFNMSIVHAFNVQEKTYAFLLGQDDDGEDVIIPYRVELDEDDIIEAIEIEDDEWDDVASEWERLKEQELSEE